MGKAAAARRLASAAAFGGGGLSVLGMGLYGVLRGEAVLARRMIGNAGDEPPPDSTGWYGRGRPGPAIKVALLGDSSAAGYGVERIVETPGAFLASGLAKQADRRVHLRTYAKVGAQSSDLAGQIDRALPGDPDLAVILIGANDVTHRVKPSQSVRYLAESVRRLVGAGAKVLVGTCPDLGSVKPIPPPLKQVARSMSRRLAAAQAIVVVEEGGIAVSVGSILGPDFAAAPAVLFGPDQFHPSAEGYRAVAEVLVPSALNLLGLGVDEPRRPTRGEGTMPVATAAVRAARTPGTELGDKKGLWVELRRRARLSSDPEAPADVDEVVDDPDADREAVSDA
ncbi:MAG TPA: SGNH/GDSL hydrolase family protein [Nocardioides sp.]|uniref:SGNH/GDSL hydrolase family protein n=1 Tax=Nocardioides sp. TaxID=35761 RepID=UPI002F407982